MLKKQMKQALCFLLFVAGLALLAWIPTQKRPHAGAPYRLQSRNRGFEFQSESSNWRQISPDEVYSRFKPWTSEFCRNHCDVHSNPACKARTHKDWDEALAHGQIEGIPLYEEGEYMFKYERAYMNSLPKLTDKKTLPDLTRSEIYHVDSKVGQVVKKSIVSCHHMEQLTFRVDFVDGYGKQRKRGGDEVRVWIKGNPQSPNLYDYSATGQVEDLKNGSYLAIVTCVWTGYATLNVGLAYPWEYIRASLGIFRTGSHLMLSGTFKKGNIEEDTLCSAHPNVPGRPCLCNLTEWNEVPFFCGKPLDPRLTCTGLIGTQTLYPTATNHLTDTEKEIGDEMSRLASDMRVIQRVDIVVKGPDRSPTKMPCSDMKKSVSWSKNYPLGFWNPYENWTSLVCRQHKLTKVWAENCLRNTGVWFFGDSNMLLMHRALRNLLKCQEQDGSGFCNRGMNITIKRASHEYPFYSSFRTHFHKARKIVGVERFVSLIPSTGRHAVLFHYYLHASRTHPEALYVRLRRLKQVVEGLLRRVPGAHVFIRGPHITTVQVPRNHMMGGDVFGAFHVDAFRKIFRDVRNRVTFLDGWDMSISLENADHHPPHKFTLAMLRTFLSYLC